ncbi:hypothetical protein ACFQ5Q_03490 [Luteolibacter ambystomatis]
MFASDCGRAQAIRALAMSTVVISMSSTAWAADPDPSQASTLGQTVNNPATSSSTTVTALIKDPTGTPTAGTVAFVKTADGYIFLVKAVGDVIYNGDNPPQGFTIQSKDTTAKTVTLVPFPADPDPAKNGTATLPYQALATNTSIDGLLNPGGGTAGSAAVAPAVVGGAAGVKIVGVGAGGSNGRAGALVVPPSSGGNGATGPNVSNTNTTVISTTNQIGVEIGSLGGNGGNGGSAYLSVWSGRNGGDGGKGGNVSFTNSGGIQIATTGDDKYGVFAYSRSGAAGAGGSGYGAPGGGSGGASSDGGSVTVDNQGNIITTGKGAYGIYALSVGNKGGGGGSQWGIVGAGGSAGTGGNGGAVSVTNSAGGTISTSGEQAHGILAQSIGGSGGSSGTTGNLILSLQGSSDNGGNGGTVTVTNNGSILTTGKEAKGIFAQSIGGGGGSGGTAGGLIALGGSGSNGGSASTVTVTNGSTGSITTTGLSSDAIFAQSVGGSGGSGSNAGGLVAVGGSGSSAGSGGVVTVENYGTISTSQDNSRGIVAQSIGGGGGDGGNSGGMVAVGGKGSGGGSGSTVTVKNGGTITTLGNDSRGIVAQSVGGGGGNGGSTGSVGVFAGVAVGGSGSTGGAGGNVNVMLQGVDVNNASLISTSGDRSTGVFAQSVGGGGGSGGGAVQVSVGVGFAGAFAVGGQGGKGGAGGVVNLTKGTGSSVIETDGVDSAGVFLQSVGGGGGNGGYSVAVAASGGPVSGSLSVSVGGNGGTAGAGGEVSVGSFTGTGSLISTGFDGSILTKDERSTGFFAQSVGGGGGNGGLAVSAAGSGSLAFSGSIAIGIGGEGGGGGNGGKVSVGIGGNITTQEDNSTGLLAQSVGGGGGNGGGSIAASLAGSGGGSGTMSLAIGGNAGTGSTGGDVWLATRTGTVTTGGENSTGIIAQSIGGGGGNGGYSIAAGAAGAGVGAGALDIGLGGKGGGGGAGGTVLADLQSNVSTAKNNSGGILIQSVGGGGGNGGFNVAAGAAGAGTGSGAVTVGLGGKGATGGIGGTVTASSTGKIDTLGDHSAGFVAQSIGGGGGNGGYSVTVAGSGAGVGSGAVNVGLGGSGGSGNDGGIVTVNTSLGKITTKGSDSIGLLAQSIGGGGGNGGFSVAVAASGAGTGSGAVNVGLGGSGSGGGDGKKVTLTASNDVSTSGKNSAAVVAQSIGGGGGSGGFSVSGAGSGAGTGSGAIAVGLGGKGGSGGDGGDVKATISGDIDTLLENSAGILAQSIGGGGGDGGFNINAAISGAGTGSGSIGVGLGGNGSGGGDGYLVDVSSSGTITTKGNNSTAFIAQSIGGGGGNGGFNVNAAVSGAGTGSGAIGVGLGGSGAGGGHGGIVIAKTSDFISTTGDKSGGILAQSIGGGGGNGGFNVNVAGSGAGTGSGSVGVGLGGSGAGGGYAMSVDLTVTNNVMTTGKNSAGIIAQSVGGGGGNGAFDVTASLSGASTGSGAVGVSIGGSAGTGGYAGAVTTSVTGSVSTAKDGSAGILSQSVGGGGGNGGMSIAGAMSFASTGTGAVSIGLGGSGGEGSYAGKVISGVTGDVYTVGNDSGGIAAQSIGGGGGNGGISISGSIAAAKTGAGALAFGLGGSGGKGGNGGEVENTVTGYVQTQGNHSTGILAQSLGGGGGNGGLNVSGVFTASKQGSGALAIGIGGLGGDGGNAMSVTNTVTGGTVTTGDYSDAIVAQSLGGGGGNGGLNVSGAVNLSKENGGSVGIGVGGFGGNGGDALDVTSTIKTTTAHNQIGTTGDHSSGVVAQSIGGGGGNGGTNVTGAVNVTGKNGAAIGVGVGGFGGGAGNAGKVTVDVAGDIITMGNQSHGILAQSIGGGGGNGGTNVSGTIAFTAASSGPAKTLAASIGVGGFGGGGGYAGAVDVKYDGTISALPGTYHPPVTDPVTHVVTPGYFELQEDGEGSNGIAAQSIGGGGGNGGLNVSGGLSFARGEGDAYGIMVGVGGYGGDGGDAGKVDVLVTGGESISAYGAGHSGILAQSVGGGGGTGATNVSGGIVSDSPLVVGVGGSGGDAGVAKDVKVTATADIYASAKDSKNMASAGIMAQSLGGGGGNGGLNVSGSIAIAKESTVPAITVGVGGSGGAGAISGDVTVDHTGNITTSGNWIHGLMAQSIAGGGGNGALNVTGAFNWSDSDNSGGKKDITVVAGVGGTGGKGADAGDVKVTQNGIVTTKGDNARGVAAQSIGGGGGNGGMNVTGVFSRSSSPISVGVGGTGSGGGHAGAAEVIRGSETASTGTITTDGKNAYGIEASSIGGGGGDAGMNFNAGVTMAGKNPDDGGFVANFAIGGAGGEAGNGGKAKVTNYSDILTKQDKSHGIIAQSIGGGGGNANFNLSVTYGGFEDPSKKNKTLGFALAIGGAPGDGGHGDTVDVIQVGDIETFGKQSYGILSQSIGGGGGNAGMDLAMAITSGGGGSITVGRIGGIGGYGGDVTLSSDGSVLTHGEGSFGMLAQSVGNGGGNSSSTSVAITGPDTDDNPAESASVSVGLEGGEGGYGGSVLLTAEGFVDTHGKNAHGIFAQSIGGGGGNGGSANTFGLSSATIGVAVGGKGGTGGYGGTVTVKSNAQVRTYGDGSVGILAQSVGGGGGTGGMSTAGGLTSKVDGLSVSVGGEGGAGMYAGKVTVENGGIVITDGVGSHGILAQSLGGGGGNSGMAINAILRNTQKDPTNGGMITVGGKGGSGAVGGEVVVTNTGGIGTSKENSIGIFAQSIGGGGGNAATVVSSNVTGSAGGNNLSITVGGKGGTGGAGGKVTVTNKTNDDDDSGKIITVGNYSHGIAAMSIGGGGGTGSTAVSVLRPTKGTSADATTNAFLFNLGGSGGSGGTGGVVTVDNQGSITTYGYKAHGILAQSIGGGGGNGGVSVTGDLALGKKPDDNTGKVVSMALGGSGGDGNDGGNVTVENSGSIEVFGKSAYGIYAQSVGGGGGDGGFAATLSRNILFNPKTDMAKSFMNIGLGGFGGDGGNGGNVTVNHTGSIISHGDNSYGIFAQSVRGGGGNAAYELTAPTWMAADLVIEGALGARDGTAGTAGTVTINTIGTIVMSGKNSTAQLGQSINGGGGNVDLFLDVSKHAVALGDDGVELPPDGGDVDTVMGFIKSTVKLGTDFAADSAASAVEATHVGDLYTSGEKAIGSLLQSIGAGGGNGTQEVVVNTNATVDLNLALGSTDATNSAGGDIKSTRTGKVITTGTDSGGVEAQSIGGGGGNLSVKVVRVPDLTPTASAMAAFGAPSGPVSIPPPVVTLASLGADGGAANNGGNMVFLTAGDIGTTGDRSYGVLYQSIGAGGGKLNLVGLEALELSLGGKNGAAGNGGNITLDNTGIIYTEGELAHGLILQSIGGGGGLALTDLDPANISIVKNTTNTGNGGILDLTQKGDVIVHGDRSVAVIAQSLGGGGGFVDDFFFGSSGGTGSAGAITLRMRGNMVADGEGGVGIFAQSQGGAGQGNIEIDLAADKFLYFGENGTGVSFSGGAANKFVNNGTVSGKDGLAAWSVKGTDGGETVENNGDFFGQVDLGAGANKFVNHTDGVMVPGPLFLLGAAANQLVNDGILLPGNMLLAQHTDVTGSFTQSDTGKTYAELDFGTETIDQLYMTGTASLDGKVDVSLLNPQLVKSGHFQKVLYHADGGVTNDGLELVTAPSMVINYQILYPTGKDAILDYNVDFSPSGKLGRNLATVGSYINRIQDAGSSPALADTVVKLMYDPTIQAYKESLSMLTPDFYAEQQAEVLRGSQRFGETLFDGGAYRYGKKGRLLWFDFESSDTVHHGYDDYKTVRQNSNGFAMGFEHELKDGWIVGAAAALEENTAGGYDGRWRANGDTERLGAIVKRDFSGTEIAGILSYSWNQAQSRRSGAVTSPFYTHVDRDLQALTAMVRVSHEFNNDGLYIKPMIDFGASRLSAESATETGAGATSLVLGHYNETHAWVRPAIEFGKVIPFQSGAELRLHAEVAYQHFLTPDHTDVIAGFAGAPRGVAPMDLQVQLGSVGSVSFGADVIFVNEVSVGIDYTKAFAQNYDLDSVNLKVSTTF